MGNSRVFKGGVGEGELGGEGRGFEGLLIDQRITTHGQE